MRRRQYTAREIMETVGQCRAGKLQLSAPSLGTARGSGEEGGQPDSVTAIRAWERFASSQGHLCREWALVVYYGQRWPKMSHRQPGETRMRWLMRLGAGGWANASDGAVAGEVCGFLEGELAMWLRACPVYHPREFEAA